jgi:hypothetical protein
MNLNSRSAAFWLGSFLTLTTCTGQGATRSAAEVRVFRADHPCPATGRRSGACRGWQVDHAIPLCAGGEDKASNMHWLSNEDHAWKTRWDVRECRKLRKNASKIASHPNGLRSEAAE